MQSLNLNADTDEITEMMKDLSLGQKQELILKKYEEENSPPEDDDDMNRLQNIFDTLSIQMPNRIETANNWYWKKIGGKWVKAGAGAAEAAGERKGGEIILKMMDGRTQAFPLHTNMTVGEIAKFATEMTGDPVDKIRLLFSGKQLIRNIGLDATLEEIGAKSGDTIHIAERKRGYGGRRGKKRKSRKSKKQRRKRKTRRRRRRKTKRRKIRRRRR